jgi:hypothetical protein
LAVSTPKVFESPGSDDIELIFVPTPGVSGLLGQKTTAQLATTATVGKMAKNFQTTQPHWCHSEPCPEINSGAISESQRDAETGSA